MAESRLASGQKNARRTGGVIVFADESGLSQRPSVRRTWAPKGRTPVLTHSFTWHKLSMNAGLAYEADGKPLAVVFEIIPGAYDTQRILTFLRRLSRSFAGRRVYLVWDRLRAHRSKAVQALIRNEATNLTLHYLPAYSPDLQPVEHLWANVKGQELANYVPDNLTDLRNQAHRAIRRVRRHALRLLAGFAAGAGLGF